MRALVRGVKSVGMKSEEHDEEKKRINMQNGWHGEDYGLLSLSLDSWGNKTASGKAGKGRSVGAARADEKVA
jgi:hypothetical protein